MRDLGAHLSTLVASGEIEGLCRAFKITRKDGTIVRFAETSDDVELGDGFTYSAAVSLQVGSLVQEANAGPSSLDIELVATDGGTIDFADIQDGLYTGSTLEMFLMDRKTLSEEPVSFWFGDVGEVKFTDQGLVEMSVVGPLGRARNYVNETYGGSCRAFFTDDRCGIDPETVTFEGTISVVSDRTITVTGDAAGQPADYFALGLLTMTSGRINNHKREIRLNESAGVLELYNSFGVQPEVGDTVLVRAGCSYDVDPEDRATLTGCRRWSNILNFRGEPFLDDDLAASNADAWNGA
jgi:uncharacterized phage protein (TIGR02218 family)